VIGVISNTSEKDMAKEFFELFKTPWEVYEDGRDYDVVLCTACDNDINKIRAKLVVIYCSAKTCSDDLHGINIESVKQKVMVEYENINFPVYGNILIFGNKSKPLIKIKETKEVVGIKVNLKDKKMLRIGFDLFHEISFLLSSGQTVEYSLIPTMEIHISMLREWIVNSGLPLIEVPPVPPRYNFIVCLTHDVDFVGIRNHKFDHTMFGFVYRALIGSFVNVIRGRNSWTNLLKNWKAVLSLPFVYLGIVKDFWDEFDRYLEIENNLGSTFFIIPFKNRAGKDILGMEQRRRAARYDITDVKPEVKRLISYDCEIGLHGIDAWYDAQKGIEEMNRISKEIGDTNIGVRMHWLYFFERSPKIIEEAGFFYDSTFGYNDAVGYKCGTIQVFRPLGVKRLLELPLHIQDTALFYSSRMALSEKKAFELVNTLIKNSKEYGGVLTINWHTRSLSPERLWDGFYVNLLDELKAQNVWFGTARQVVTWFNKRRSVSFEDASTIDNRIHIKLSGMSDTSGPDLLLKVHHQAPQPSNNEAAEHLEIPFSDNMDMVIPLRHI
jgi:hypothetical protein